MKFMEQENKALFVSFFICCGEPFLELCQKLTGTEVVTLVESQCMSHFRLSFPFVV